MSGNVRLLIRNLRKIDLLRQDVRSLVTILGQQPKGSTAWKCGNLAKAILDDFNALYPEAEP